MGETARRKSFSSLSRSASRRPGRPRTFTSGGLEAEVGDGRIAIKKEGKFSKFVAEVGQITFSGHRAAEDEQEIYYVTERCVFKLSPDGLELIEVAPGIDVEKDILERMPFAPVVGDHGTMDPAIFEREPLRLRDRMLDLRIEDRLGYDAETNTIFMNFAGMRVRAEEDVKSILDAVDAILGPLGKRVNSIVNYDRFEADPEVMDKHLDAVRYVENRYYIKVSRYTTSGFMRLKLGKELERRSVSSHVFETGHEARRHLGQD